MWRHLLTEGDWASSLCLWPAKVRGKEEGRCPVGRAAWLGLTFPLQKLHLGPPALGAGGILQY